MRARVCLLIIKTKYNYYKTTRLIMCDEFTCVDSVQVTEICFM